MEEIMTETKQTKVYGGEGCHWYTKDGQPMYEVASADGKRKIKTTLRQARTMNLFPSVTTILKVLEKSGVNE